MWDVDTSNEELVMSDKENSIGWKAMSSI